MKAIIVKDNDFKTIGFEVISNGKRIFAWGVSPVISLYFIKEVNAKDWETDIINLMKLNERRQVLSHFSSDFFDVLSKNEEVKQLCNKKSLGFSFDSIEKEMEQIDSTIKNIIDNIR